MKTLFFVTHTIGEMEATNEKDCLHESLDARVFGNLLIIQKMLDGVFSHAIAELKSSFWGICQIIYIH